ncbi:Ran GTPase binding protein Sbp1 [Dimargaris verticillata]|uniref:Ran GTPase binding protein Sbp1 n=1 Tax=Dimargaris verticillata TaxID=2761393 RepID=A0A9W8B5W2_9FUNG|nr:Ran GTPase binding protein Sbp1 [Dimargaris verticillata]
MTDQEQTKPKVEETTKPTTENVEPSPDVHFEPVVKLSEVEVRTLEEDEEVVFKMRAKLFRFDKTANEWKERGTGDVKLLQHAKSHQVRVLMRRDKTFKICANHLVTEDMRLAPNIGSERSWVWNVAADISDGEPQQELLAIRFANADNAQQFKDKFDAARENNSKIKEGQDVTPLPVVAADKDEGAEAKPKEEEKKPQAKEEAKSAESKVNDQA